MSEKRNPNEKQPGEKKAGKFHYNPGNMSGKSVEVCEDADQKTNDDRSGGRRDTDKKSG
jgi:hypothetical protein